MDSVLIVIRLMLFATFITAAVAKLTGREASRLTLVEFGVPNRLVPIMAAALPLTELPVAVALLFVASAWFGAVGALGLLTAFIVVVAATLARGRKPLCNCFGQMHAAPIGWTTLTRNTALGCLAAFLIWRGPGAVGPSLFAWLADPSIAAAVAAATGLVGLAFLGGLAALMLQILRQQGRLLLRFDAMEQRLSGADAVPRAVSGSAQLVAGLPIQASAPAFQLIGLDGATVTLGELLMPAHPVLLIFINPHCGPCDALVPEIFIWQRNFAAVLTICLISEGSAADNLAKAHRAGEGIRILLQRGREVADAYHVYGTPAAVLVRRDGMIGSAVAQGADAIRALVSRGANSGTPVVVPAQSGIDRGTARTQPAIEPPPRRLGEPEPSLEFEDLNGKVVALADFLGRNVILLFWNPSCGYCQQMLGALRQWERDRPPHAPLPLIISTGTVAANRAMELNLPIVLDHGFQAGAAFGARGTPMAIRIDTTGRVASDLVAGAEAVLALASAPAPSPNQVTAE